MERFVAQYAERNVSIYERMAARKESKETAKDVGDSFGLSAGRCQQIFKDGPYVIVDYDITLTDGIQSIPVAVAATAGGFMDACRIVRREYCDMFARLELPNWKLRSSHGFSVSLKELAKEAP